MTLSIAFLPKLEKHQQKLFLPRTKHNIKGCSVPNRREVKDRVRESERDLGLGDKKRE